MTFCIKSKKSSFISGLLLNEHWRERSLWEACSLLLGRGMRGEQKGSGATQWFLSSMYTSLSIILRKVKLTGVRTMALIPSLFFPFLSSDD